jgi:hypothetical protein
MPVLNEHRESLLVSGEAIRLGVGASLFMARLDVFPYLACCAWNCCGKTDAWATAHIHACIDGDDVDVGVGLLHKGRATLVTNRHPTIDSNNCGAASSLASLTRQE